MPPPTNTPGIYPRTRYQRLTGVPGLPTEPKGPRPPYSREPGPPRNTEFWLFFSFLRIPVTFTAPPLSGFQSTHLGRHYMRLAHARTHPGPSFQAPVFRPQDHCEPHRAAPRKFRKHGSRTCRTPYQHSWDIPKNAVPAPDRGSGAPAAHRVQGLPAPLRQGAWPPQKPPEFWLFFPFYASQ